MTTILILLLAAIFLSLFSSNGHLHSIARELEKLRKAIEAQNHAYGIEVDSKQPVPSVQESAGGK